MDRSSSKTPLRWLRRVALSVLALGVVGVASTAALSAPRPEAVPGADAEALTDRIEAAVDVAAWERTRAVAWTFGGTEHLWDRDRHLSRQVRGNTVVLIDLNNRQGKVWKGDRELSGRKRDKALKAAWGSWANDSFWLNPLWKLRDAGTTRGIVPGENGEDALLISYSSGGVTPGDAYLWHVDSSGRPTRWQMWVKIIPIGGVDTTWENWQQLSTGAWVATEHDFGLVNLTLTDVRGAATLAELEPGADPFAPLLE